MVLRHIFQLSHLLTWELTHAHRHAQQQTVSGFLVPSAPHTQSSSNKNFHPPTIVPSRVPLPSLFSALPQTLIDVWPPAFTSHWVRGERHKDGVLGKQVSININQIQGSNIVLLYGRWQTSGQKAQSTLQVCLVYLVRILKIESVHIKISISISF